MFYKLKTDPTNWGEFIGNKEAVKTFQALIANGKENKIIPAITLIGTAGSGKTGLSYLFAKAVSCASVDENQNPCGTCDSCKGFQLIDDANHWGTMGTQVFRSQNYKSYSVIVNDLGNRHFKGEGGPKFFIFDDANNLSKPVKDILVPCLEKQEEDLHYLCMFQKQSETSGTIASYGIEIKLNDQTSTQCQQILKAICIRSSVNITDHILKSISDQYFKNTRNAINKLQQHLIIYGESNE